jgi:sugar lactone lactonase YvrE
MSSKKTIWFTLGAGALARLLIATVFLSTIIRAADPLPALDWTITKYLGTTGSEQVMLNRVTPSSGCHLGGVHIDKSRTPHRYYVYDSANNRILGFHGWRGVRSDGTFPPADIVIGQPSGWDHGAANGNNEEFLPPTASTLALIPFPYVNSTAEGPRSATMATDAEGNLYVPDMDNNRVLKFTDPFETDAIADEVWGQPTFTTRALAPTPSASSLNLQWKDPGAFGAGVHVDPAGNLWVTDSGNHRVLRFPMQGSTIAKTANLVIGQPNFTNATSGTALNRLYKPQAVKVHPVTGELYILDGESPNYGGPCRLLVFAPPFANGMSASREIGKASPGNRASGFFEARGFAFDPLEQNAVWVADGGNHRILKMNTLSGAFLDVIGRPDFTLDREPGYVDWQGQVRGFRQADGEIAFDHEGNLHFSCHYGTTGIVRVPIPLQRDSVGRVISDSQTLASGWNSLSGRTVQDHYGMAFAGSQLFVRDNNRVLVWNNVASAPTFAEADLVIGQDSISKNDPGGTFLGQQPARMHAAGGYLFAATDNRIFIFATPVTTGGRNVAPLKIIESNTSGLTWADDGQPVPFDCTGLVYDPAQDVLWISDYQRNRILRVANPLSAAPQVNLVIGQTSKSGGEDNHGLGLYTTDARGIAAPWMLVLDNFGNLYAVDSGFEGRVDNAGNRRVLRFDAAAILPVPGNIFPNPAASGVFCKATFTTNRDQYESNRPETPTHIAFNSLNQMILLTDGYGNLQRQRVWFYPTPHLGTAPQPTHVVPVAVGQAAVAYFNDADVLMLQDHTWNRVLFISPAATAPKIQITASPSKVASGTTHFPLSGTCNPNVTGNLTWSTSDGFSGSLPASANWTIPSVPLGNSSVTVVTVSGSSADGTLASVARSVAVAVLSPPAIHPPSGTYEAPLEVSAPHFQGGVTVRYTLDGSVPGPSSPVLGGSLVLESSATFKARAFAAGMPPSEMVSASYVLTTVMPTIEPSGAVFVNPQQVAIGSILPGSIIRYTLDGSEPDEFSTLYGGPVTLDATVVLKARVFRPGNQPGPSVTANFIRTGSEALAPVISPDGGTFHGSVTVSLMSATPGALIRFTLDGQDVTANSPVYAGPFAMDRSAIIKARAEAPGFIPSTVTQRVFHLRSPWSALPLPAGQTSPDRHVALGSDGRFLYFTKGNTANAPFFRMPRQGGAWQSLAPLPIPPEINSGGVGDMGYLNGRLYTFARRDSSSLARALFRYDIASNTWSRSGPMLNDGVDTACVPIAEDRILGGWIGWTRLKEVRDPITGEAVDLADLSGGAVHAWDGCAGSRDAWFLKQSWNNPATGVFARMPFAGPPVPVEIAGLPFNPGIGCAIEAVPGEWFADGHERIFVLRGGQGTANSDGNSWTEDATASQLAIYDAVAGTWTSESLPFAVAEGSEMARVDDTLFILASRNQSANPLRSFKFSTPVRPRPPRNESAQALVGGIRLNWRGNPGQAYVWESSTDLIVWKLRGVLLADDQGFISHDEISGNPRYFHRISP